MSSSNADLLKSYVDSPDGSFQFTRCSSVSTDCCTVDFLWLCSQTWQGLRWEHWLTVVRPVDLSHQDSVLLWVAGGDLANRNQPCRIQDEHVRTAHRIATETNTAVAVLQQVPNQPLFGDRREDALIAFTFDKFLNGDSESWPLLFPMVKIAVRAMDALQAFLKEAYGQTVDRFAVTGASKRGWTTWLTGATDRRVAGIAPMVFDVLNITPQMEHQVRVYGTFSDKINDYTELRIQERMGSPVGQALLHAVDPFSYAERMLLPKLVVLGTNDEYWTADSANLYFDALRGEKHLHYEPNGDHDLGPGAIPAITGFFTSLLEKTPMPRFTWRRSGAGIDLSWEDEPLRLVLWKAHSDNRDFRGSVWMPGDLPPENHCWIGIDPPKSGWTAFFASLHYPSGPGRSFALSTPMTVLPKRYPEHAGQR